MTTRAKRLWIGGALVVVALALFIASQQLCLSTWWRYRVVVPRCPDGNLRQTLSVEASGLRRGAEGSVYVGARASYTERDSESRLDAPVTSFRATLALVNAAGAETPLPPVKGWESSGSGQRATVKLPDIPDGDYRLRARVTSRLGEDSLDVPLPLYAPARVHVVTDRPLYEPGNTVRFRAVVLRARDLAPLDGRPGRWVIHDPTGEVVLEEKAPAGPWGVVAGSFPLDKGAPNGSWRVSWVSADAADEVPITVEPFTLPRFRVEATADRPFYRPGDRPVLRGAATYSSGAPVAGARVEVAWDVDGEWPPPTEWLNEGGLPAQATTGPAGSFQLDLPAVPADLEGQATLRARIAVIDAAGDRVAGAAQALLSKDAIQASAVTELADGLVGGFNNRVYLRVVTADGRVLGGAKVNVRRAWAATDKGIDVVTDEDGVASLQLDPGAPVNVVIPPQPYRPPPRRKLVARGDARPLAGGAVSLDDQVAMDRWLPALEPCAKWVDGERENVTVGLRIDEGGGVANVAAQPGALGACVADKLRTQRLPAGAARVYAVAWQLSEPDAPRLDVEWQGSLTMPAGLDEKLRTATRGARDCLPAQTVEGPLARALVYRARVGRADLELMWIRDPAGAAGIDTACVEGRLRGLALDKPAERDELGVARFRVTLPERLNARRPQATVMEGYELLVSADGGAATKLRMSPGTVPPLRLRTTPVLAQPGDVVSVDLIRGPGFRGEVPEEVVLDHLRGHLTAKVDRATRTAKLTLDAAAEGWCEVRAGGVRALVFVRPRTDLAVSVTPGRERYAPGQDASLAVRTTAGGRGGPAAVGLFGVDESLGQLATLRGPDDMGRVRPTATMSAPAFGILDGQALTLGRIRGANAAAATVLRVTGVPAPPEIDATVNASAETLFDPTVELIDRFYLVLGELHAQVRRWEKEAPAQEMMAPPTMAALWQRALDACAKRGERTDDAFGRRLRLHRLPADLLALTDPRAVVMIGTRLPEDIESWPEWVGRVRP